MGQTLFDFTVSRLLGEACFLDFVRYELYVGEEGIDMPFLILGPLFELEYELFAD